MLFNPRHGPQPSGTQSASEQIEMQAVRELLFGETQRALEARIQHLESAIASLESGLGAHLRELSQRFEELGRTADAQQSLMRDVGRAFAQLGQQLSGSDAGGPGGDGQHVHNRE